ncbi:MAG: MFS transporter [Pseudomonadota bacterium]|nr:MFS transporter [Pseudomonadota bacterium]
MAVRVPANLILVVFCPFAAGYFLSFFFRNVNAIISKDLATEFSLAPSDLGFLTSMYLLAFAAFQLPLGVLLDRYGPRRVVAALLCVAGVGALTFALARDFTTLSIGRALIGLGVSAGLMGAIKAFTLWFPLSRLATLNGLYLAVGGIGGLSATAPAEALVGPFGWRALFLVLSVLSVLAASLVFFVVPEKRLPGEGQTLRAQIAGFGVIFASLPFWRIALGLVVCHAGYLALQGLWLAPWLYDVARLERAAVANYLLVTALAYTLGSVFFGVTSDRLARAGVSRMTMFKLGLGLSLAMFALLAAGVQTGLGVILAVYGFTAISASLAYAVLTPLFPPEMTGRVNTASNVLMFGCSFAFQWGVGAVLKLYPVADGHYAPEGYATALTILAALQLAALAWLLPLKMGNQPRL